MGPNFANCFLVMSVVTYLFMIQMLCLHAYDQMEISFFTFFPFFFGSVSGVLKQLDLFCQLLMLVYRFSKDFAFLFDCSVPSTLLPSTERFGYLFSSLSIFTISFKDFAWMLLPILGMQVESNGD